jgi:hypothetical protein
MTEVAAKRTLGVLVLALAVGAAAAAITTRAAGAEAGQPTASAGQAVQAPPATPQAPPPAQSGGVSATELERIRKALAQQPTLRIDEGQLRFYMEIIAKWPTIEELLKGVDLVNAPTRRGNPMTHAEFLAMVTPKEMYGSAGIRPSELLQFALVNWIGKAIVMKGLEDLRNAKTEREMREIRDRIDRELAALAGRR